MTLRTPHKRIPGMPWTPPADTWSHSQDSVTTSVHGSHVHVTVKLRSVWAVMLGAGDHGEFRAAFAILLKLWRWFDCGVKIAVCAAVVYFAFEIGSAFLPGGAAYQAMENWK